MFYCRSNNRKLFRSQNNEAKEYCLSSMTNFSVENKDYLTYAFA